MFLVRGAAQAAAGITQRPARQATSGDARSCLVLPGSGTCLSERSFRRESRRRDCPRNV